MARSSTSRGALASVLRVLRNGSLRRADATAVIGDHLAARIAPFYVSPPVVIPNWALEECREPSATSESNDAVASHPLRASWGLGEAFIVGYSGDMGRASAR